MEQGYFYKFINNEYLESFCKKNNIEKTSNIFLCSTIDDKIILFNVIDSETIDYDVDYYIQQKINNVLYYIDITKIYEIEDNGIVDKISNIKHRLLQKKCNSLYENIKENYEEIQKKKHHQEKYIGNIIKIKENEKIQNLFNSSIHKSTNDEEYLIVGKKDEWYYGCYVYKNEEKNSIPVYKKTNNRYTVYGYININDTFKLLEKYFSDIIINEKRNVYEIYKNILKIKNQTSKKVYKIIKENIDPLNITIKVKKNNHQCEKYNHRIKNYLGTIKIITRTSNIIDKEAPIFYCDNCKEYSMLEYDYNALLKYGQPFCKIIVEYLKKNDNNKQFNMNEESELYAYGYNVSQTKDLTVEQRRKILTLLVDNNLMSKSKIMNHLSYLINSRQGMNNFRYAISKWKEDREYISSYKKENLSTYKITTIKRKEYY